MPSIRSARARALGLAAALACAAGSTHAEAARSVVLYTVGPAREVFSRFGHSILCVRGEADAPSRGAPCYDYGVGDGDSMPRLVARALRDEPTHVPVAVDEVVMLTYFRGQGRRIERQEIGLERAAIERLQSTIEGEIRDRIGYAYNPYWANCSTKLRDHLDAATDGRLRAGPSNQPPGTFRDSMEYGHRGDVLLLGAMALGLGVGHDLVPTPWQAMLLPTVLRDGVTERLGAQPEVVAEHVGPVLPASPSAGRGAVVVLALGLAGTARAAIRRGRARLAFALVGAALGLLALGVDAFAAYTKWPEIAHNWTLFVLWPTDLALPFWSDSTRRRYLVVRLGAVGLVALLALIGLVAQAIAAPLLLAALPLATLLRTRAIPASATGASATGASPVDPASRPAA
jgi:hypothetical protein